MSQKKSSKQSPKQSGEPSDTKHPSYADMIKLSLQSLPNKTKGQPTRSISRYIKANYKGLCKGLRFNKTVKNALHKLMKSGAIEHVGEAGELYKLCAIKKSTKSKKTNKKKSKQSKRKGQSGWVQAQASSAISQVSQGRGTMEMLQ